MRKTIERRRKKKKTEKKSTTMGRLCHVISTSSFINNDHHIHINTGGILQCRRNGMRRMRWRAANSNAAFINDWF